MLHTCVHLKALSAVLLGCGQRSLDSGCAPVGSGTLPGFEQAVRGFWSHPLSLWAAGGKALREATAVQARPSSSNSWPRPCTGPVPAGSTLT